MALIVSTTCLTKSFLSPAIPTHRRSCNLPSKSSRDSATRKTTQRVAPLRVAAPPSPSSVQTNKDEGGGESLSDYEIEEEFREEGDGDKFIWKEHWYPVSLIEDLDPALPTPFQLLGLDLVLWFDRVKQEWVAFDDKCPHRLAPLSEGRIDENGDLQCSYHGWSFDGSGSCTRIPQAMEQGPEARAVKSPRACATRFPTRVSQGLLFVWPDDKAWEKALATKPPM